MIKAVILYNQLISKYLEQNGMKVNKNENEGKSVINQNFEK